MLLVPEMGNCFPSLSNVERRQACCLRPKPLILISQGQSTFEFIHFCLISEEQGGRPPSQSVNLLSSMCQALGSTLGCPEPLCADLPEGVLGGAECRLRAPPAPGRCHKVEHRCVGSSEAAPVPTRPGGDGGCPSGGVPGDTKGSPSLPSPSH